MSLKHTLKESFTFSKKERIGIICLLPVLLMLAFLPFFQSKPAEAALSPSDSVWLTAANKLQQKSTAEPASFAAESHDNDNATHFQADRTEDNFSSPAATVFVFDPNTLDADGFKKLGLRDKTIQILLNYRNKGGKFRKPDDLGKIYGLRSGEFERLKPYIKIAGTSQNNSYTHSNASYTEANSHYSPAKDRPSYTPKTIEINAADIAGFESLYGIGNKLAGRIINFRDKLGGFYSIDQVGETYGVPDSTFQKIKLQLQVNTAAIRKININTASYEELNNHPYISGKTAFHILKQRKEKGNFTHVEEIKELVAQTTDSYEKVSMYLTAGN